jgi:prepilin-type N-terminal cleavage/methylation domain-containing protein
MLPSLKTFLSDKLAAYQQRRLAQGGFTMIELLIVIAIIGVLAVAVLSSINPIEQINKGRDTRLRSDASQLLAATDRYYASKEVYPWNVTTDSYTSTTLNDPEALFDFSASGRDWDWGNVMVETAEIKESFVARLASDNSIIVAKPAGVTATTYACFLPASLAFKEEAMTKCADGVAPPVIGDFDPCEDDEDVDADNYLCLP